MGRLRKRPQRSRLQRASRAAGDGRGGAELCEVCADAEVFALAGEDDDAHVGVVAGGSEGLVEVVAHGGVEGVMDVGSVESYVGDGAVFFVDDDLGSAVSFNSLD